MIIPTPDRYKNLKSEEFKRLERRKYLLPSTRVQMIPYDKLELTDAENQIREFSIGEDTEITSHIKSEGLHNPIFVAPHPTKKGYYIIYTGHTRPESCLAIIRDHELIAEKWGFDKAIPAYVYDKPVTDPLKLDKIKNVLNYSAKSNTTTDGDLKKSLLNLYYKHKCFTNEDGTFDTQAGSDHIVEMQVRQEQDAWTIARKASKEIKKHKHLRDLTDFEVGCIKQTANTNSKNSQLFKQFNLSTRTGYKHSIRTKQGLIVNLMCGVQPNDIAWVRERFGSILREARSTKKKYPNDDIAEVNLCMHITKPKKETEDATAKECLDAHRSKIFKMLKNDILPEYLNGQESLDVGPITLKFVPQWQLSTDEDANEQFGEEVMEYAV
jgi:hypothetical protein